MLVDESTGAFAMIPLGETLKTQRKANGMAVKAVAARLTISAWALEQFERGLKVPSIAQCKVLARLYGTSAAALLDLRKRGQPVPYRKQGYTPHAEELSGEGTTLAHLPARMVHAHEGIRYGSYDASPPAVLAHTCWQGFVHFRHYGG
jgi:transcriptional regulator with XRE-family HTH domain